jgi:hypothetical protein
MQRDPWHQYRNTWIIGAAAAGVFAAFSWSWSSPSHDGMRSNLYTRLKAIPGLRMAVNRTIRSFEVFKKQVGRFLRFSPAPPPNTSTSSSSIVRCVGQQFSVCVNVHVHDPMTYPQDVLHHTSNFEQMQPVVYTHMHHDVHT